MPYVFEQAANDQAVAEYEYANVAELKFTAFTSCIGIGYKSGQNSVFGLHLVIKDEEGNTFTVQDIATIEAVLQQYSIQPETGIVLGSITAWKASIPDAYQQLIEQLGITNQYQLRDGVYGLKLDDEGDLEITY